MSQQITDAQIEAWLNEPKPVPKDFRDWFAPNVATAENINRAHVITGGNGSRFGIHVRQGMVLQNDFSIGLRLVRQGGVGDIPLARCNGWHEEHKNMLDRKTPNYRINPNTCHIHTQQARYFAIKPKKIGFALETNAFNDLASAIEYFVENYGFVSAATGKPFRLYPLLPPE